MLHQKCINIWRHEYKMSTSEDWRLDCSRTWQEGHLIQRLFDRKLFKHAKSTDYHDDQNVLLLMLTLQILQPHENVVKRSLHSTNAPVRIWVCACVCAQLRQGTKADKVYAPCVRAKWRKCMLRHAVAVFSSVRIEQCWIAEGDALINVQLAAGRPARRDSLRIIYWVTASHVHVIWDWPVIITFDSAITIPLTRQLCLINKVHCIKAAWPFLQKRPLDIFRLKNQRTLSMLQRAKQRSCRRLIVTRHDVRSKSCLNSTQGFYLWNKLSVIHFFKSIKNSIIFFCKISLNDFSVLNIFAKHQINKINNCPLDVAFLREYMEH